MQLLQHYEDPLAQITRLLADYIMSDQSPKLDDQRRIRLDDHELSVAVRDQVKQAWTQINTDNLYRLADYKRYKVGFRNLFGFEVDDVDYDQAVETELLLP